MLGDLGWRMRNGPENHTVGWEEFDVASFPHLPVKSQETGAVQVELSRRLDGPEIRRG